MQFPLVPKLRVSSVRLGYAGKGWVRRYGESYESFYLTGDGMETSPMLTSRAVRHQIIAARVPWAGSNSMSLMAAFVVERGHPIRVPNGQATKNVA